MRQPVVQRICTLFDFVDFIDPLLFVGENVKVAYQWWCAPNDCVTLASGATYNEKRSRPREEPCGTPILLPVVAD